MDLVHCQTSASSLSFAILRNKLRTRQRGKSSQSLDRVTVCDRTFVGGLTSLVSFDEFVAWCEESQNALMMATMMPAKRLRMYQVHCQMLGVVTTTMAEDFGLGAFY
ncbi:unnamed protein product [Protopolystoma xenopodis]|uniref:Uncharacterized protein n=1 Tax=Protopolystoma xenopodis TaxID=117903 RepID=A0A448WS29_9PLAT|nr:unnamed protein product [Protopolystoma xenopodis]